MASLAIHIRPGANPSSITKMIFLLAKDDLSFSGAQELLEFTASQDLGSYAELYTVASSMGLLEKADSVQLSEMGRVFAELRENTQGDILHFFMYSGWQSTRPREFLSSWAYRNGCDRYWQAGELSLSPDYLDRQVQETINEARQTFQEINVGEFDEVSFSLKSLQGLHSWLEAVQPPVIEDKTFNRRAFCPPELLLLAVSYVVRDEDAATETDILLSRDKREAICRLCLLEPDALDRALDWMLPIYPKVIEPGTSAGFYGRFVRLHKIPTLVDVVR
jgi:hypothetical protein